MSNLGLALLGSAVTILSTSVGALPAVAMRWLPRRGKNAMMGFSAGVMLAATAFSLLLPALEMAEENLGHRLWAGLGVSLAVLAGALLLHLCNRFVPHEHFIKGPEGMSVDPSRLQRIWLFVLAIAIHNFPEGLAVGTGAGSGEMDVAGPILVGIALQDIPEGFVVAVALLDVKYSWKQALGVAFLTGLLEGGGALLGYFAVTAMTHVLPWALALAGGSMLYVVSDEMIPESHRSEHAREATTGLMLGFVLMMFLDVALT